MAKYFNVICSLWEIYEDNLIRDFYTFRLSSYKTAQEQKARIAKIPKIEKRIAWESQTAVRVTWSWTDEVNQIEHFYILTAECWFSFRP